LGHEGPFEGGGETGAAASAQPRALDLICDPVAAAIDERLGVLPGATRPCAGEVPVALPVEIGEDAVLVSEHHELPSAGGAFLARGLRGALPPSNFPAGDSAPVALSRIALFGSPFALAAALTASRSASARSRETFLALGGPLTAGAPSTSTSRTRPFFVGSSALAAGAAPLGTDGATTGVETAGAGA